MTIREMLTDFGHYFYDMLQKTLNLDFFDMEKLQVVTVVFCGFALLSLTGLMFMYITATPCFHFFETLRQRKKSNNITSISSIWFFFKLCFFLVCFFLCLSLPSLMLYLTYYFYIS